MDWYFGNAIEDLTVPKDEEMFDGLSSTESWSPWGKIVGNFNSSKKSTSAGAEELQYSGTTFCSEVEQLSAPNVCQGARRVPRESAYPHGKSDLQVDDYSRFDEADDIFLHSIYESEISGVDTLADFTQTSRNHIQDCTNDSEDDSPFLEAMVSIMEPEFEICASEEHSNASEDKNEEDICLEESVLQELKWSTLQMAEETRICFRDSLYRLAENSRQQTSCSQNSVHALADSNPTTSSAPLRFGESYNVEESSNKNVIDRTIATLLFNTMKFCNLTAETTLEPH
ncbi:hypothetical protein ACJIZ3_018626 [Penstemon smallii]|uniref:Protein LNK3 n=1 Tax=Penstemon smallii TaxID=265156 RepID=A0ABD3SYW0_9LAMI